MTPYEVVSEVFRASLSILAAGVAVHVGVALIRQF